ncbi:glycoside hydrolase family 18 protein, partial [Xylona heveae TC161]
TPRLVLYHQTQFMPNGDYVSLLPLVQEHSAQPKPTPRTAITHIILAAIHLNANGTDGPRLNDDPYGSPRFSRLWEDVRILQRVYGIKVLGMLGGACRGSFAALAEGLVIDDNASSSTVDPDALFEARYAPLRDLISSTGIDGLDLDVEEPIPFLAIVRLISRLKADFGDSFIITLAPVATALRFFPVGASNRDEAMEILDPQEPQDRAVNLSGFNYFALEGLMGDLIDWYNVQFYCGWGNVVGTRDYDEMVQLRGWPAQKLVLGLATNPSVGGYAPPPGADPRTRVWPHDAVLWQTLGTLRKRYAPSFGGVMGWEYFNAVTTTYEGDPSAGPWCWAKLMTDIL